MKDPVRARTSNLVFERATIELWLQTRGSVCPITLTPLEKADLYADDDLRIRIKRYHIQQMTMQKTSSMTASSSSSSSGGSSSAMNDDDLYDF
jgi:hypothetical protein